MRYLEFLVKLITNSSPSISISAAQNIIGVTVAALFNVGLLFLGFTSIGGAILPGCPFRSAFSDMIRFIFEKTPTLLKWILHERLSSEWNRRLWIAILKISFLVLGGIKHYFDKQCSHRRDWYLRLSIYRNKH